jgi:hypothetical protein
MTATSSGSSGFARWAIVVLAVLAVLALLGYRRNDPGVGERVPDPEDAISVVIVDGAGERDPGS